MESVYQQDEQVKEWLKSFMTFPLMPQTFTNYVWQHQLQYQPVISEQNKISEFLKYFYKQWLNNQSLTLNDWNHFDNTGPRTNNHVEGFNYKLGEYIDCDHPNIFSLIETFKSLEMSCVLNYLQRKNGHSSQSKRRKIDIMRDERISNLKFSLNNNHISILDYFRSLRNLYSLSNNKKDEDEEINKKIDKPKKFTLEDHNDEIDKAFNCFESRTFNNIFITLHDIKTLSPNQWLNDTIIDYYYCLILMDYSHFFCFSTYFFTSLCRHGLNAVKKWYLNSNIFSYKKIFIPILESNHWLLVVVDLETYNLILYDSFSKTYNHILEKISDYLQFMYKILFQKDIFNLNLIHARSLPLQKNYYDCGVYICKFAEFICKQRDFTFSDIDMMRYRRKMILSILRNKVM